MELTVFLIFIIGYIAITFEHSLRMDKLIPALLMMALAWAAIALNLDQITTWFDTHTSSLISLDGYGNEERSEMLHSTMLHHFGKTVEILVFLMGAMAIVEMIDHFKGFHTIKSLIRTRKKVQLLWIISGLAFALSAIIDNLTATIVLITILRKLIPDQTDRMWYAGMIIISANAGGAWTPIGDVTTTMLWMAGKVTAGKLVLYLGIPSLLCMLVPVTIASFLPVFKGNVTTSEQPEEAPKDSAFMLYLGLALIIFVPVFKTITHLPPYFGMMLSLGLFAVVAEIKSKRMLQLTYGETSSTDHLQSPTLHALSRIEMPSILFFLGILMTVAAMESMGMIFQFGQQVNAAIPQELFVTLLGAASAVIDNVPLVAASIGMFTDASDAHVWHYIAYAAGTGGSMLIIGSAAGVVAMGMERITFGWYLKHITLLAFLGYVSGIGVLFLIS